MEKFYPLASTTWDGAEFRAMQEVIETGQFTMGEKVRQFEQAFAAHFGSKYAVMSNSGSSANLLALAALRYSKKFEGDLRDEIIVPAVSWSTTYYPITQLGYKIKFVDIDLNSLNLNASQVEQAINERTVGIFAVNLLGNPADLGLLRQLCERHNLFFIEDNCESMGATLNGKMAGTFGDIGTFSTFFSHHISTMEGGVCVTDDLELAQLMVSLRAHGWTRELPTQNLVHDKTGDAFEDSFRFVLPGYNLRPLELSGAIGIHQLAKLDSLVAERRRNAEYFLHQVSEIDSIITQSENGSSSWFGFSLILKNGLQGRRRDLVGLLLDHGIDCRPIVAGNFTKNPVMKHLRHVPFESLPNADKVDVDGLFIGNHHFDLRPQIDRTSILLKQFADQ